MYADLPGSYQVIIINEDLPLVLFGHQRMWAPRPQRLVALCQLTPSLRPIDNIFRKLQQRQYLAAACRQAPEVPKFVFMSACFETHGPAKIIPQPITFSVGSPPT